METDVSIAATGWLSMSCLTRTIDLTTLRQIPAEKIFVCHIDADAAGNAGAYANPTA